MEHIDIKNAIHLYNSAISDYATAYKKGVISSDIFFAATRDCKKNIKTLESRL